ncbi:WhiB family transcriptional regulator [Nocardia tengchongensis]
MTAWIDQAACRTHPNPDLWFPATADDPAYEARRICRQECPVRLDCGEAALTRSERHAVAGGYRMWEEEDLDRLRAELPHVAARFPKPKRQTAVCSDCGESFGTTKNQTRCGPCRGGLVAATATRNQLLQLRKFMTTEEIGARTGISPNTLSGIVSRTNPPERVKATTEERVLDLARALALSA